jgi:hypothetical protein
MLPGQVDFNELESVPEDVVNFALSHNRCWRWVDDVLRNMDFYDSRTPEWESLLNKLCSCTAGQAEAIVWLYPQSPPKEEDIPPDHLIDQTEHAFTMYDIMKASPFCSRVEAHDSRVMISRMQPIKDALPFVMDACKNPLPRSLEARFPKGYYVISVSIRLRNFHVRVHAFRGGVPGDPTH